MSEQDDKTAGQKTREERADSQMVQNKASAIAREAMTPETKVEEKRITVILAQNQEPVAVEGDVHIGNFTVRLPSAGAQQAGFELPQSSASVLLAQYYTIYKIKRTNGQSQQGQSDQKEKVDDASTEK